MAKDQDAERRRQALDAVLSRYLPAMREMLIRWRVRPDSVDDLLQDFCATKILDYDLLAHADPNRGRFRALLTTALRNFVNNEARKNNLLPGPLPASDDSAGWQPEDPAAKQPNELFDVIWAQDILSGALQRMQAECEASGRHDLWTVFRSRWVDPWMHGTEPVPFSELAGTGDAAAVESFHNLLVTAKRRFHGALAAELGSPDDLAEEIADLVRSLKDIGLLRERGQS